MSDCSRLQTWPTPEPPARMDALYARTAADRPALRRLMADIRRGGLRSVVVRDLARLARNAAVLKTILDEFRAAGVEVVTTREGNRDA